MADNPFKRYLDAGIAFTALTQSKAQAIVKDLVSAGEVQTEQAQAVVADLLDRSRQNTEKLLDTVRKEVGEQVKALGLVGQAEIARLEKRIETLTGRTPTTSGPGQEGPGQEGRRPRRPRPRRRRPRRPPAKKAGRPRRLRPRRPRRAKKAAAKKAAAKKKAPAKKAAGQEGGRLDERALTRRGPRARGDGRSTPSSSVGAWSRIADEARAAIAAGRVVVGGAPATNPARQVDPGDAVALVPRRSRYASRAGEKLHAALDRFGLDVAGRPRARRRRLDRRVHLVPAGARGGPRRGRRRRSGPAPRAPARRPPGHVARADRRPRPRAPRPTAHRRHRRRVVHLAAHGAAGRAGPRRARAPTSSCW